MRFSVIVPTYHRETMISKCIKSILEQSYKDYEIVIVDDNGLNSNFQKKTYEVVEKYKYTNKIKYIVNEHNLGACGARNVGANQAIGDYIAFLDDDDVWNENFLELMNIKIKESNSDVIYCDFYRKDERGRFYNPKEKKYEGYVFEEMINGWCPASTSLFCVRRECFLDVEGFNTYLVNMEEYDLWMKLACVYNFDFCNQKLVVKDETKHNQLTNECLSRIEACQELSKIWSARIKNDKQRNAFLRSIEEKKNFEEKRLILARMDRLSKKSFKILFSSDYRINIKIEMGLICILGNEYTNYIKVLWDIIRGRRKYI